MEITIRQAPELLTRSGGMTTLHMLCFNCDFWDGRDKICNDEDPRYVENCRYSRWKN